MAPSLLQRFRAQTSKKRPARQARLQVELLEDRLTPSWAGVPPTLISPPASPVAVTLNSQNDASGEAAITSNEVDYYRFTASAAGSYVFSTQTSIDSVIGIFSASGSRLAYNDDISTTNLSSRVSVSLSAGQVYYLGVTNYTGTAGGVYLWTIDGPAPAAADDAYENNDSQSAAFNLGTLTARKQISNLVMADGHDWYRFTTSAAGTSTSYVAISFTHSQGDLDIELRNTSGVRVGLSNGLTNAEQISLNGLAAGTYYVHVYGYNGASNPAYSLDVNPPAASTPPPSDGFRIELRISGMTTSQQAIFLEAAARWEQAIVGDLPNATYGGQTVDDIRIDASGQAIDGSGGILGQAGPDSFRSGSSLPIHGVMQFDTADLAMLEQNGQLQSVILHEMGHVLGIGTIWSRRGLLSGAGTSNPRFTGAQATAEYNRLFGVNENGVPVENGGGAGTRDSHWRESTFGAELMTGYINFGVLNPMSRMTILSLADLGYQVNANATDTYNRPGTTSSATSTTSGSQTSLSAGDPSLAALDAFWANVPASLNMPFAQTPAAPRFAELTPRALELSTPAAAQRFSMASMAYLSGSGASEADDALEEDCDPAAGEQNEIQES